MKKYCLFITALFACCIAEAQNGFTFHAYPSTYAGYQLMNINDIYEDAQQNMWIAFPFIGLGKFNGGSFSIFNTANSGIPSDTVYAVVTDNLNNLWAATNKGLVKYDGASWTVYDSLNSPLPGTVYKLHINGNLLWCGTHRGAVSYNGSIWTVYNNQNSGIAGDTITTFASGNNGELWIGTSNMGISEYYANTWATFNTSNSGLGNNTISRIAIDAYNDAWIVSGGLYKKSGNGIVNFLNNLYDGVVTLTLPLNNIIADKNGKIIIPYFYGNLSSYNTINGNGVEIINCVCPFQSGGVGIGGTISVADHNNHCWNTALMVQNGVYGIASFDKLQSTPIPFAVTNANAKFLDINDVKAVMLNRGDMHWDLLNAGYTVPRADGKKSVFASGLWMGGLDNMQNLHVSAQTYRQEGNDYWPGPIDTVNGASDSATAMLYDKIWKVDRNMIEDFKYHFNNGTVTNGTFPVPEEIATWPAQGTGNITRDLAPFVDFNADGIYNPMNGDYPLIKGDEMLYWIINDNLAVHEVTTSLPLGVEVHCSAYAYVCDQLSDSEKVMQQTTFYQYRIINRSQNEYHNFYIGLWSDMDVGNPDDDFLGCDTVLNAGFTYNADNDDDGSQGYGLNPPMQNIKILDGPLADAGDGVDNDHDGTIDEPGEKCLMSGFMVYNNVNGVPNGVPASGTGYYNYMRCYSLDGITPLTYEGNGIDTTTFCLSGTPYDTVGWSWTPGTGLPPTDVRLLVNTGPFTLPAGGEATIDFAYVFTRDTTGPNGLTTSVARNKADLQRVQHWFDYSNFPSCLPINPGIIKQDKNQIQFTLQPNPATDVIYIKSGKNISGAQYVIYDVSGRTVLSGEINNHNIKIDKLESGMYFLEIERNGVTGMEKFIKQ